MRAMLIDGPGGPIHLADLPVPQPADNQVQVRVSVCGLCRTDLHVLDGELSQTHYPIVPGHQIVGTVSGLGTGVTGFEKGDRIGIPWLGHTCGSCHYCLIGKENLCADAAYTGCQINGGFADYCVADARYCFRLPQHYDNSQVAPLLCAGLIGYRAWNMTGNPQQVGFMGFGASAHILAQVARHQGKELFAFTRRGDLAAQQLALALGATWAGASEDDPGALLDAVIIFAPAGELVPRALSLVRPGGKVVCAGIHMSEIPAFSYDLLWQERSICSVANLTRQDGLDFLALAETCPITTEVHTYDLESAGQALEDSRS